MSTNTTRNIPASTVGIIVHRTIADLLNKTRTPSSHQIKAAIKRHTQDVGDRMHVRAVRQRVFGLVSLYFWHLALDESWEFVGAELTLGTGRVDLTFRNDGWILIDEVKSGVDGRLALGTATQRQTDRYVTDARQSHGDSLVGVRVLSLTEPGRSLLKTEAGISQSLLETPYHPERNN